MINDPYLKKEAENLELRRVQLSTKKWVTQLIFGKVLFLEATKINDSKKVAHGVLIVNFQLLG